MKNLPFCIKKYETYVALHFYIKYFVKSYQIFIIIYATL